MVKIIGLAIANGLVSLGGCVFAQQQRYFDVSMGTGTMVIGLASVIIGTYFQTYHVFKSDFQCRDRFYFIQGAVCGAFYIRAGFPSTDLKAITAVLFLVILILGNREKRKVKIHA